MFEDEEISPEHGNPRNMPTTLSLPCLETLHISDVYDDFLSTLFASTITPRLSYLNFTHVGILPSIFETFLGSFLPALVENEVLEEAHITVDKDRRTTIQQVCRGQISLEAYFRIPEDRMLNLRRIGRALGDGGVAVTLQLEPRVALSAKNNASFLADFPSLKAFVF